MDCADVGLLEANLAALSKVNAALADRLRGVESASLQWEESKDGQPIASVEHQGRTLTLASRFDPEKEAEKLVNDVDPGKHACAIVLGFGLGYHVRRLAKEFSDQTLIVVHQPDISLLRSVFEHVNHVDWLSNPNIIITDETTDRAALMNHVDQHAATLTQGTVLVTHPASRQLFGEALQQFGKMVTEVVAYCRTSVATALVNASRTITNLINNVPLYAGGATCNELFGAAKNKPAVCVSAGPSLARNVKLLADPQVRKNVVVITAQTTLKTLLDHGVKPDFVTALDYHEISKRFYDGLPALPDVTLVAEPKVNAAVAESFPGPIRMTDSHFLDSLLGKDARTRVSIRDGATVAHLSFYLAQHLGCDPIMFIGQDLGYSDGLYYCPGTAIHNVWASELNPFNSIEMMEWQRIVRMRSHLQKQEDIHGKTVYSDEQMLTYLKQFERDFATASQTLIDATEGGLPKAHTTRMKLSDALDKYATSCVGELPVPCEAMNLDALVSIKKIVEQRICEIRELYTLGDETIPILKQMQYHQRDAKRMKRLFERLERKKNRVSELEVAFSIVNDLNSVGVYNRAKADRAIVHFDKAGDDPFERQRQQLDRDMANIDWLLQAYEESLGILTTGLKRIGAAIEIESQRELNAPSSEVPASDICFDDTSRNCHEAELQVPAPVLEENELDAGENLSDQVRALATES
jgi:hypothetical protein